MKANKSYPAQLFNQAIRYEIPPYQRRYIWEQEKQWEPLWEDVRETAEDWLEGRTLPHFTVLSLNRELLDNAPDIWDETAIAERAHRLCQAAIKVWPHADGI